MSDTMGAPEAGSATGAEAGATGLEASTPDASVDATPGSTGSESTAEYLFEIDGKGITREEAQSGYLRQSDYTRKTQELAETRRNLQRAEAIQQALAVDPKGTLEALAEAYGVDFARAVQDTQHEVEQTEDLDPTEARLRQLEADREAQQAKEIQAHIDHEVAELKDRYGAENVDEQALFLHAINGGFTSLAAAYRDMTYDSVREAARKADEEARREAARQAQLVEGGAARTGTSPSQPQKLGSVRDAFYAAKKELGLD